MNIKILYDNLSIGDEILAGWGFSCLVGERVLFDTGEEGRSLLGNMKKMKVEIADIKDIVISHDHWDHIGGLETLLKKNKDVTVYGCKGFSSGLKDIINKRGVRLMESTLFSNITGNIFTTGSIKGAYKDSEIEEQSLVLKTTKGMSIVTGCAHPGIIKIVEQVKALFPQEKLYCVLGGFHMKGMSVKEMNVICEKLKHLGVQKAGPSHCSGEKAINLFKKRFGREFVQVVAGKTIEV